MNKVLPVPIPDYFYYFPRHNDQRTVIENRSSSVRSGKEEIVHELYSSDGIYIWYSKVRLQQKKQMLVEYPSPFIHINYAIKCNSSYRQPGQPPFATFLPQEYNILFLPAQQTQVEWIPGETVENFEINLTTEFFERLLPDNHPFMALIQNSREPASVSPYNLPITAQIQHIIYDMLRCNMEPGHKRLYLKAKTLELLAIQLQQQSEMEVPRSLPTADVKVADIKKMHMVREIILQHLDNPHTLVTLAHMVGTNECYLKRNFKKVFGTTVYGYVQQTRMERARDILLQEKRKIGDVAKLSGYSHVSHFSKAFKKHFGFSPQKIKLGLWLWATELYSALLPELSVLAAI